MAGPDLARIKRNVAKMAAQNAPESDIDGYISSEGVTVDDVRNYKEVAAESQQSQDLRAELSQMTQKPNIEWTPAAEVNAREDVLGTSTLADMTASGMANVVPFLDEAYSATVGAPIRAVSDWAKGDGFDYGRSYEREQAIQAEEQRRRDERSPIASLVGKVGGGLAAGGVLAKGGVSLLNGAQPTLASMAGRGALEGAAYGGAYGAGEGSGINERIQNALWGAGTGAVIGGGSGALGSVGAGKIDRSALPTADDWLEKASAAYQRADDAGVMYSKDAMTRIRDSLTKDFAEFGYHPELQPGAKVALNEINRLADQDVTFKGLDTARKIAGNAFQPGNKSNNALNSKIVAALDDLVANPQTGDVIGGDAIQASLASKEARAAYSQGRKLEAFNDLLEKAGRRAARTGSGGNIQNTTKQELSKILDNPKLRRGFTPDELKAVEQAVMGTPTEKAMRLVGKLSPEGNGLMMMLQMLGGATTGGATLPTAAVGMAAKRGAEAMQRNSAQIAESLIASGGKLPKPELSAIRKAIVEALTVGSQPLYTGQ